MGRPTPNPRDRRNRRQPRGRLLKKPKKVKPSSRTFCWPAFPLSFQKHYDFSTNFLLGGFPRSSVQAVLHFQKLIAPPEKPNLFSIKSEDIRKLAAAFYENIRARWQFRRLVLAWRLHRCKKINEEDPMTLEAIKQPVELYDLYNKAIYTFEAKSLARAWKSNLLNHDGAFPEPKYPLNPLINLSVNLLQIHTALKTIRQTGHIDWVLDSFASCQYNLTSWNKKFGVPLKIESLTSLLADKSSYDRYDMLMDFAELQYEYQGISFPKKMFEWIFLKHEVEDYVDLWIRACKKFYVEKYTIMDKEDLEDLEIRSSITNAYLVEVPEPVKLMYQKYVERFHVYRRRRVQNRVLVPGGGDRALPDAGE
jgi:hypothetical protein